jgi:hypothetical protein
MLKLRRGVVSVADPLVVRIGDEERPAWEAAGDGLAAAALVEAVR